ncbi:MAG: DUF5683 domain-containing protein [Candidatus Kapabacteria bacterium]|nr:DUF5683 domain-containing protein [Candidatus Kapabacteria bacterium]
MRSLSILLIVMVMCCSAHGATDSVEVMTKSPTTAVLYSLLLPGLGQVYTESYWKVPLFTGTAVITAWQFFKNNADFNTTSDLYDLALASGADPNVTALLLRQREAYRDNRDLAGVIFLVTYGLAAMDAYVGAHLFDFDVSDDVSMGLGPTRTQLMAVNLRYQF